MNSLLTSTVHGQSIPQMLAQLSRDQAVGRRTAEETATVETADLLWAAAFVVAPLAMLLLWKLFQGIYRKVQRRSPLVLFWQLCREHRLGWRRSFRLWRRARQLRLEAPALLFVSPGMFRETSASEDHNGTILADLHSIYQTIFRRASP